MTQYLTPLPTSHFAQFRKWLREMVASALTVQTHARVIDAKSFVRRKRLIESRAASKIAAFWHSCMVLYS